MRKSSSIFAVLLAVAGVVLFFTAGTLVGAIACGVGLAIFGWAMTRRSDTSLVGKKCAHCGDGIYVDGQADRCMHCQEPLHARCIEAHVSAKHRGAYR